MYGFNEALVGVSASDMEVIRSEWFCQAITYSENCSLVKGKGRYIRFKQSELKIMTNFVGGSVGRSSPFTKYLINLLDL